MKIATIIVRVLLGLAFVVFGCNLLHPFLKMPAPAPDTLMGKYFEVMFTSHYIMVVGALQVAGGLILLIGKYVPLGLTLLGPVMVNILCVHIFLAPEGLPMALIFAVLMLFLLFRYRSAFAGLVRP